MSEQEHLLQHWLPTTLSRHVAKATMTLAATSPFLFEFLQKIGLQIQWLSSPTTRILLLVSILFLGSFILLLLMLRHIQGLHDKADLEEKLTLISKYLELNRISWSMVKSDVIKHESFNEGFNEVLKSNKKP